MRIKCFISCIHDEEHGGFRVNSLTGEFYELAVHHVDNEHHVHHVLVKHLAQHGHLQQG